MLHLKVYYIQSKKMFALFYYFTIIKNKFLCVFEKC